MKALTLWQPWASLVALGVKMIETRSWSTSYRGPLAIHAAKTADGFYTLPGDCEGTTEAGWRYGYIGRFQAAYCYRTSDEGTRGDAFIHDVDDPAAINPTGIPLGVVVATCTLVDVVPIVGYDSTTRWNALAHYDQPHASWVDLGPADGSLWLNTGHGRTARNIVDQRPFGDFTPGRYAWLLDNMRLLSEPVGCAGGRRLWSLNDVVARTVALHDALDDGVVL